MSDTFHLCTIKFVVKAPITMGDGCAENCLEYIQEYGVDNMEETLKQTLLHLKEETGFDIEMETFNNV